MTDAALLATFADFKLVRTRSVAQLVFEVPIEAADDALSKLGGIPQPGQERHVGIARVDAGKVHKPTPEPKPSRRWEELTPAQQAGIRCEDQAFQRFVEEAHGWDNTVEFVRWYCGVASRALITPLTEAADAWRALDDEFQAWLREPDILDVRGSDPYGD